MARDLRDAYAALGLRPGADADAVAAAYRDRAKALHPDRAGHDAAARMAAINAAHDVLTAALLAGLADTAPPPQVPPPPAAGTDVVLDPGVRRALGPELVAHLGPGEAVEVVAEAATWASPRTVLALTDRRLLWLLDDAVSHRVRQLRYDQIEEVGSTTRGRLRRSGLLRVRPRFGRPTTFAELSVAQAPRLAERIRAGMA